MVVLCNLEGVSVVSPYKIPDDQCYYLIGDNIWSSHSADAFLSCISDVSEAGGATILPLDCPPKSSLFAGTGTCATGAGTWDFELLP